MAQLHSLPTRFRWYFALCWTLLSALHLPGQGVRSDSSRVLADGTVVVTRVVPLPSTVSPEAQRSLARQVPDTAKPSTLEQRRHDTDAWQTRTGALIAQRYPVTIQETQIGGVPVRLITPQGVSASAKDVLINLHGGGFNSDSGSLSESIPVAVLAHVPVVAVLYRLAPENKFPAAVDDATAVYQALLKSHSPQQIGIFGTSAGAVLTAEMTVHLKRQGIPLPAVLGIFSGMGDFSRNGDSQAMYALGGLSGYLAPPQTPQGGHGEYTGTTSLSDPVLSPLFADLHGLPPTLFVTSGRDLLLSGTTILHRAFLRSGVDARLVVFEALPHAFWNDPGLPETREAHELMAAFLMQHLAK